MPGDSEHPVTLGDLRRACEHKRYDEHAVKDGRFFSQLKIARLSEAGDREALATVTICKPVHPSVADLVSALRAEGYEVGNLCKVCADAGLRHHVATLGFIQAEAQPFPPAGG